MTPRRNAAFIAVFVLIVSLACSFSAAASTSTPTPDFGATQALQTAEAASATASAAAQAASSRATAEAEATAAVEATSVAQVTQEYLDTQSTKQALATLNESRKVTKQASTQVAIVAATEQAKPLASQVEQLNNDGILTSVKGIYYQLPDFNESWAQINWYKGWPQFLILDHFIIRADAEWDSASKIANLFNSGCGFVFGESGQDNHYTSFLGLDGWVHSYRYKNGLFTELTGGYYGKVDFPTGKAQLMLVVDNYNLNFYVNGKKVVSVLDHSLGKGMLSLTIHSGTNTDYGIRCKMSNIEVWALE